MRLKGEHMHSKHLTLNRSDRVSGSSFEGRPAGSAGRRFTKRRGAAAFALLLALLGTSAVIEASPAGAVFQTERRANFSGYCKAKYTSPVMSASSRHGSGAWSAVTWRCRQTSIAPIAPPPGFAAIPHMTVKHFIRYYRDHEIDVDDLCRWQYGPHSRSLLKGQSWRDWRCLD